MRRCILELAATFWLVATLTLTASAAETKRPNVLFLFTDDQRPDAVAALGNPHIKTPNLDSLVRSGFVFRNAYCMGSDRGAVCFPSRNMLMSGRAYFRLNGFALPEDPNFPDSMKRAGYYTYHHGKLGNTARKIHEVFNSSRYLKDQQDRMSGEPGKEVVDAAIEFLDGRDGEQPFFMYLAFSSPHDPRVAAKKYTDEYDREKIPLPKNYMPVHPFDNGWMIGRDERLAPWPRTEEVVREHLHDYYAVITGLDHHIGRLLQDLKARGEYDNTLIIFSSDHGLAVGSHGLFGKQNLYEHSAKAPLVFSGPNIVKGESDALVYLLDIYPTVCDLIGADVPQRLDGKSLVPIMTSDQQRVRNSLFTAYEDVQRAIREDRWKLIRYPQINRTQLFDLRNDPDEVHDLAGDPRQAERIERMLNLMGEWQERLGDDAPLSVEMPKDPTFVPPSESDEEKAAGR